MQASHIKEIIETAYSNITKQSLAIDKKEQLPHDGALLEAIRTVLYTLDCGGIRVAEAIDNQWITHQWIKQAILLAFKLYDNTLLDGGYNKYFDKIPLKFRDYTGEMFKQAAIRSVPDALVRQGAYIGRNSVLMPCYINVGAYVGDNVMVDTWATIGSCAQIGNNVHISGGAGIGGVLEPLQDNPTIIEDNCFIGARSEIVEGVIVREGTVISMGVFIGQSTKIYNRMTNTISYGEIPPYSVVVPGSLPSNNGTHSTYAAIIVKQVDAATRAKVSINKLLRD